MLDLSFYKGKKVLLTGHTGFKGTWMCKVLADAGALVTGYALKPPTSPSLFELSGIQDRIHSVEGDIRDLTHLQQVFEQAEPEIVIHMAAQPIVRESYRNPVYTYEVNVMGTVNMMECIRKSSTVISFVNVTTDKVYKNKEWEWGYRENEELNGFDPYSNSKSCSELVTDSFKNSFFGEKKTAISTVRAGNVIGGGDFAADRIVPDCIRAVEGGQEIIVRNPYSTRPFQHVLEPVMAYLVIAGHQYENPALAGSYNIGPEECDCITTGELVTCFCDSWNKRLRENPAAGMPAGKNFTDVVPAGKSLTDAIPAGNGPGPAGWVNRHDGGPHEAHFLKLDCSKVKRVFGWKPVWHAEHAIDKVTEWSLAYLQGKQTLEVMERQIAEYKGDYDNV